MGLAAAIAFPAWTALVAATSLLAGVWAVGVVGPLPAGIARLTEKLRGTRTREIKTLIIGTCPETTFSF